MYVIKNGNGKYVSKPGSYYSYTDKIEKARIFKTKEATIGGSSIRYTKMRTLQHYFNSLHVYCYLLKLGFNKQYAKKLACRYGRLTKKYLYA